MDFFDQAAFSMRMDRFVAAVDVDPVLDHLDVYITHQNIDGSYNIDIPDDPLIAVFVKEYLDVLWESVSNEC